MTIVFLRLTVLDVADPFCLAGVSYTKLLTLQVKSFLRQVIYMCTMLLIPLIPIVALVTQNMIILNNIIVRKADLKVRLVSPLIFLLW